MKNILLVLISVLTLCACEETSEHQETPKCKELKKFPSVEVCSMPDNVVCYIASVYRGIGISCIKLEQKDSE